VGLEWSERNGFTKEIEQGADNRWFQQEAQSNYNDVFGTHAMEERGKNSEYTSNWSPFWHFIHEKGNIWWG
jgi:hypothetical protein